MPWISVNSPVWSSDDALSVNSSEQHAAEVAHGGDGPVQRIGVAAMGRISPSPWLVPLTTPRYSAPIGAVSQVTLDRTFFALSDSTRRSILTRLADGPATIGDLAGPFGLTLNGVKKHVVILEEVDLVVTTKVGRSRECRLGPAQLQDVTRWIDSYRRAWEQRLEQFGAYVESRTAGDG